MEFQEGYGLLYGKEQVVYSIHVAGGVHVHGPLDSTSSFSFEKYLGELKRIIG